MEGDVGLWAQIYQYASQNGNQIYVAVVAGVASLAAVGFGVEGILNLYKKQQAKEDVRTISTLLEEEDAAEMDYRKLTLTYDLLKNAQSRLKGKYLFEVEYLLNEVESELTMRCIREMNRSMKRNGFTFRNHRKFETISPLYRDTFAKYRD